MRDLVKPEYVARFAGLLPRHIDAHRFARVCAMAVFNSAGLQKCHPQSLLQAFLTCASLGLEPNTPAGYAYVLPYGAQATLVIGYRGYVAMIHRSDPTAIIHADVVREGDEFTYAYGTDAHIRHVPALSPGRDPIAAYAYIRRAGEVDFGVMAWHEVLAIRDNSAAFKRSGPTPWKDHLYEMAKKTAIRRLVKTANVSALVQSAAAIDASQEADPGVFPSMSAVAIGADEPIHSNEKEEVPNEKVG